MNVYVVDADYYKLIVKYAMVLIGTVCCRLMQLLFFLYYGLLLLFVTQGFSFDFTMFHVSFAFIFIIKNL